MYDEKTYQRNYYQTHKEYFKNYAKTHPNKQKQILLRLKMQVLTHYGGSPPKCACCGENHIEFLTIDHIDGDGAEQRRQLSGSSQKFSGFLFYEWLIINNFPKGYQVLCCNCNMAKGRNKVPFCPVHHPEFYL
jgi:hypothetical protein